MNSSQLFLLVYLIFHQELDEALEILRVGNLSEQELMTYEKALDRQRVAESIDLTRLVEMQAKIEQGIAEGKAEGRAEGEAKGRAEGEAKGKAEGKAEGRAEGEAEGRAQAIESVAIDMLKNGMDINLIMQLTKLSVADINRLKNNIM